MLTDSNVPDYSCVTGERLADFRENTRGTRTYIYKYNQSEFDEYYSYLEKDGWEIYDYNSNDASLMITYYMLKDSYLIFFDCKFYISPSMDYIVRVKKLCVLSHGVVLAVLSRGNTVLLFERDIKTAQGLKPAVVT